jgi:hypothetical protein
LKIKDRKYNQFLHALDGNRVKTGSQSALMSDAELQAVIDELTPKTKTYTAIAVVFFILGIVLSTYVHVVFNEAFAMGVLILFLGTGGSFVTNAKSKKTRLKDLVSSNIVHGVLADTFELQLYAPGSYIAERTVRNSGLLQQPFNRISGSDLVEGTYRGVKFSFSDLHIQHETGSGKNRSVKTRFHGQWLICGLAKDVPFRIMLRERGGAIGAGKRAKSSIETENMDFNKRVHIETKDPHTAFYVLTPHFMEYILKAKKRANACTQMLFNGREVHIALHNGRDLFEPFGKNVFAMKNIQTLRMQMKWDVNYITGVIDELLLNENLFGTEAKQ